MIENKMDKQLDTVWIISKYGSSSKYGISSKPYRTAKYLSEIGIETYLISSDSNHLAQYPKTNQVYNREKEEELNHIWIKTLKYSNSASIKRLLSWIDFELKLFLLNKSKIKNPDVVIVSSLSLLTLIFGLYLKKKYKCKLVFEIRDIYPLTFTEELGVSKLNPIVLCFGKIEKIGYKKSDLIVGTMPNLSAHVKTILGYDKETFFSPLGINDIWENPTISSESSEAIDQLFPNKEQIVVGYAGSMGETNALDSFITAIEQTQEDSNLYYVLVGEGDLKSKYIERLKGCKNVTIGPKISQKEVPYFLSKCDILYLSTKKSKIWEYGQSMNKLVDYMMAGKPVVASYAGYPSMLNEAGSGVFVEPNSMESIKEGISMYANMSKDNRNKIGEKGKIWAEKNISNQVICEKYAGKLKNLS